MHLNDRDSMKIKSNHVPLSMLSLPFLQNYFIMVPLLSIEISFYGNLISNYKQTSFFTMNSPEIIEDRII